MLSVVRAAREFPLLWWVTFERQPGEDSSLKPEPPRVTPLSPGGCLMNAMGCKLVGLAVKLDTKREARQAARWWLWGVYRLIRALFSHLVKLERPLVCHQVSEWCSHFNTHSPFICLELVGFVWAKHMLLHMQMGTEISLLWFPACLILLLIKV